MYCVSHRQQLRYLEPCYLINCSLFDSAVASSNYKKIGMSETFRNYDKFRPLLSFQDFQMCEVCSYRFINCEYDELTKAPCFSISAAISILVCDLCPDDAGDKYTPRCVS